MDNQRQSIGGAAEKSSLKTIDTYKKRASNEHQMNLLRKEHQMKRAMNLLRKEHQMNLTRYSFEI